ncbi:MAG: hypothetical protein GF317_01140 [Candidatus Lokiarchaeota archaeon]|nr:hypothetical protein [Candidatus Lokiarchaeota archaeon]MBD3198564.1 hypothetical protein [Candidatus Lokiarchaeota archaeon]
MTPTKFIHIADLHLGKRQYNLEERYFDYFRAFKWILKRSIKEKVDFILISGDLFDNRKVGPSVLTDVFNIIQNFNQKAKEVLQRKIPIICIEGNHDNPIYSNQSWMTFLADLGLIVLLSGTYDKNNEKMSFDPYNESDHRGGMIEIDGINIYGIPFYGSSSSYLFEPIYHSIKENKSNCNILMMHFGIEGYDTTKPGIKITKEFEKLHRKIDYLALGHYHMLFKEPKKDPWIFNPGSLEVNDLKEIFNNYTRGALLVSCTGKEIRPIPIECENGEKNPDLIPNRRFLNFSPIDISKTSSFKDSIDLVIETLKKSGLEEQESKNNEDKSDLNLPIVLFSIKGEIPYSRLDVNINQVRQEIIKHFSVLGVRIFSPYLFSNLDDIIVSEEERSIDEIENEVFNALVKENPLFQGLERGVVNILKDIKSDLLTSKPNYHNIKEHIKAWCLKNANSFEIPKRGFSEEKKIEDLQNEDLEINLDETSSEIEEDIDLDDFIDDIDDYEEE